MAELLVSGKESRVQTFDVIVIGAGMVGGAAALSLAQQGFSVAIVEANEPTPFAPEQPLDLRVSAISAASSGLLQQLGVWPEICAMRVTPFDGLETWEQPQSQVSFTAESIGQPYLGHIIENRVVQLALWQAMVDHPDIELFCGDSPRRFGQEADYAFAELESQTLQGRLLLGCDGAQSQVRQQAGIGVSGWQYRQHCLVINVATESPQQSVTWQQFTPSGPRAFLPMPGQNGSLVWYDAPERITGLSQLSNDELEHEVLEHFPARLGEVKVLAKASFPLARQHAQQYYQGRMVLLGDAAHTINPLAGQGVNLGFKDVAALAQILTEAKSEDNWDSASVLQEYERQRRRDNLLMQSAMDVFYSVFSNDIGPLSTLRNIGLMAAERSGPLKTLALRYAMGL